MAAIERKRVGGIAAGGQVDPAVTAWQQAAAENPATVTPKQRKDRQRVRIFVDVTPELKAALESIAGWEHGEDTSVSQAVEMLLTWAARAYQHGDRQLRAAFSEGKTHARTPKFSWNVTVPEEWETDLRSFGFYGKADGKLDGNL